MSGLEMFAGSSQKLPYEIYRCIRRRLNYRNRRMLRVLGMDAVRLFRLVADTRCVLLVLFAYLLTLVDTQSAGRAYAIYGGIYIAASLGWLWAVEGIRPDRWDTVGSVICILGALVILCGPRTVSN